MHTAHRRGIAYGKGGIFMVDSLWFVLALVLLAVVSVALVLVLVLQREEAHCGRETRTEYLQPNYGETGGFRVSSAPSSVEPSVVMRVWPFISRRNGNTLGSSTVPVAGSVTASPS